jgi:outer membrane murein-binding lipoprotein Lpp
VIEIAAAVVGASIGIAGVSMNSVSKRNNEAREAVIRLSMAVEGIAGKIDELHTDMREHNREIYGRLNNHAERIRALESH